jgi:hypothetical protein
MPHLLATGEAQGDIRANADGDTEPLQHHGAFPHQAHSNQDSEDGRTGTDGRRDTQRQMCERVVCKDPAPADNNRLRPLKVTNSPSRRDATTGPGHEQGAHEECIEGAAGKKHWADSVTLNRSLLGKVRKNPKKWTEARAKINHDIASQI